MHTVRCRGSELAPKLLAQTGRPWHAMGTTIRTENQSSVPRADGEIDWHRIVRRLKQAGYKGVLSVECGTEEQAARSLAHLTQVLQDEQA